MSNYVIIGNSTAAIGAVEGIRVLDKTSPITIISAEPHHTYSRPLISYLLKGDTDLQRMKYRGDDFYKENNVTALLGKTAVELGDHAVKLDDGATVKFDKLLLATGSTPFVPPMAGLDTVSYHSFYTLDDANALEAAIGEKRHAKVLIVGAGLIGLKCAEGILSRVGSVTVVDLAPKVLSSILDDDAAAIMKTHLEHGGIRFHLSDSVKQFAPGKATLNSGRELAFDILVMAVGVRPNTALTGERGGFVIDERMQTAIPDVYAAGDCAKGYDASIGDKRVLALLPNAYRQGECAGINMAGGELALTDGIPMNAIGFFGLHIVTAGTYEGEAYAERDGNRYKKLFFKDNILKGFIIIGDVERAGIYTALVREKTPLDSLDFEKIRKSPGLIAFSTAYRKQKLGAVV
ncbi:pyridine nucleotide-disulfide oxidoreductase [Clostridia bacterium]|nr:pyridine nucleotide-disulfide oxidoreductase [Clostridia bacterium]